VTTLVHGVAACRRVRAAGQALFGLGELAYPDEGTLAEALAELPPFQVSPGQLASGWLVAGLMAAAGIAPSLSAARRAIAEGCAYMNNRRVSASEATAVESDLLHGRYLVLRRGKRAVGAVAAVRRHP
jgi:tyrosyl-tRNA synthetase